MQGDVGGALDNVCVEHICVIMVGVVENLSCFR